MSDQPPFITIEVQPTITIHHPEILGESMVINAEDFDPTKHQRWSDKSSPAATKTTSDSEVPEPKRRGRAPKAVTATEPEPKKRGRAPKAATAPAPEPKKRGRTPKSTSPTIAAVPEPETPNEILVDAVASVPAGATERLAALEAMEASDIKAIAEKHGIPRPRSGGWKAAIPRIVAVEFPEDEPAAG